MQSITTKFLAPTNFRGARVAATTASGRRLVVAWDDELDIDGNHARAARELALSLDWTGSYVQGSTAGGGQVFVAVGKPAFILARFA